MRCVRWTQGRLVSSLHAGVPAWMMAVICAAGGFRKDVFRFGYATLLGWASGVGMCPTFGGVPIDERGFNYSPGVIVNRFQNLLLNKL